MAARGATPFVGEPLGVLYRAIFSTTRSLPSRRNAQIVPVRVSGTLYSRFSVVTGNYPVLEKNVEDPRDAGAAADPDIASRVAALQQRVEILGVVGRECFAPRMTFTLRDGRRVTGEYHGRELMWDFARDARELRRFVPGLPVAPARYDALVQAIAHPDAAVSVDEMLGLTLTA
jgi:hypothetical protein